MLYQQYFEPKGAFYAGAGLALRYHFLSLGRFVPYLEAAGTAGGTNLKVFEIDSTFTFVVWGGLGASFFVTDQTAIYAGYRYEHVSNGEHQRPQPRSRDQQRRIRGILLLQVRPSAPSEVRMKAPIAEILLAGPRGFCAGVERAIDIVEVALSVCPPPVYVRREIVHNRLVVETLRQKGAIFVDELDEVPDDATVIFSAHGISPAVREEARRRGLRVIDATCPLVTKVHLEAIRYAREGYSIVLIGHEDHDEVIGTLGEAPERIIVVDSVEEVERLAPARSRQGRVPDPDHTVGRRHPRRHRGPAQPLPQDRRPLARRHLLRHPESPDRGEAPGRRRRCAAGDRRRQQLERQAAGRGGPDGRHARLPDQRRRRHPPRVAGRSAVRVGITAGASTPEILVSQAVEALRVEGVKVREVHVVEEDVRFALPQELTLTAKDRGLTLPERTAMRRSI